MLSFKMKPLSDESKRKWVIKADGVVITPDLLEVIHDDFGKLIVGERPEGYQSWVFEQKGNGGAVTIPFACSPTGQLLVGLIKENRGNLGDEPVWCIIGGFVGPKEMHENAKVRTAAEKAGLDTRQAWELGGKKTVCNRLFWVVDVSAGQGDIGYALRVPLEHLEPDGETWKVTNSSLLPGCKKPNDVRFFPWRVAALLCPDGIANSTMLKFLAEAL